MPKFHIENEGQGKATYVEKRETFGYMGMPLGNQLDQLWHDIDRRYIAPNTTAPDTWYQEIKQIRDRFPKEEE